MKKGKRKFPANIPVQTKLPTQPGSTGPRPIVVAAAAKHLRFAHLVNKRVLPAMKQVMILNGILSKDVVAALLRAVKNKKHKIMLI